MNNFITRQIAKKKLKKTAITDAGLARSGFFIVGDEFQMMDLTIKKQADGYYHGIRKLSNLFEVAQLVYGI